LPTSLARKNYKHALIVTVRKGPYMKQFLSRRKFLSAAAAGMAAMTSAKVFPVLGEECAGAWVNGMRINPAIDNLRVVNCFDPGMIKEDPKKWDPISQNAPVVAEKVRTNINAMACALAQKPSPSEAWALIFRKPETKQWPEVKVAIKPNASMQNNSRVAIIDAICEALMGLGVKQENITLYDLGENGSAKYLPFLGKGLPEGLIVSHKGHDPLGGTTKTSIPKPHPGKFKCTTALVNGTIDIIVNIATNKGHMISSIGGISLSMKNHAGSFEMPLRLHAGGGLEYIIAFNKADVILGGSPVRQQLCIVDSLWAVTSGPNGVPNKRPCAISMGTFAPALDWAVTKRIREQVMGCSHPPYLSKILTEFGYSPSDCSNLDFVNAPPA
jgi:hypothetical protein